MASGSAPRQDHTGAAVPDLMIMPQEHLIMLDTFGSRQVLTNTLTHEQCILPTTCEWELLSDPDGTIVTLCGVDSSGEALAKDTEEFLYKELWQDHEGNIFYRTKLPNCWSDFTCMEPELAQHRVGHCTLAIGTLKTNFKCNVFAKARHSEQKFFWHLADIHLFLGIKMYDSKASKWVGCCMDAWMTVFTKFFGHTQLVLGTWMSKSAKKKQQMPFHMRCCEEPGVSTCGLIFLLLRWCTQRPQGGGLADPQNAQAARSLLTALLQLLPSDAHIAARVECANRWRCSWPRPPSQPDGNFVFLMDVAGDGTVNLTSLMDALGRCPSRSPAGKLKNELMSTSLAGRQALPLEIFLTVCMSKPSLQVVAAQVIQQLAVHIEARLLTLSSQTMPKKSQEVDFRWNDDDEGFCGGSPGRFVAQYLVAGVEELGGQHLPTELSFATDKGWARTLPLQVTVVQNSAGVAVLALPQVMAVPSPNQLPR